jgi:hypothetical protein
MQQIADWLEKLGMSEYIHCFAENKIDVSILPHLTVILSVWRVCRHSQRPKTAPFPLIADLAHAHRPYGGFIADLNARLGA